MAKKTVSNKIYTYTKGFGSLEAESLKIDYLRFNLKSSLRDSEISTLATHFRRSGFSSYKKERDKSQKRTSIFDDKYFEVTFILYTPYHDGTHLEFAGESANQLYSVLKSNKFKTSLLKKYGAFLRRIDTCYDRTHQSIDKLSKDTFFEATLRDLKKGFPQITLNIKGIGVAN